MRAVDMLRRVIGERLGPIHAARVAAVFAAVEALVRGGDLVLSRLGRAIAVRTGAKHGIKRVDRLYGNPHLRIDLPVFYRAVARVVIGPRARPVLLVDWTKAGDDVYVLAAAMPYDGRAIVVYAEAHPTARYMAPRVEAAFLRNLRGILPAGAIPIIVSDAGFRGPWLRSVERMGWDYVSRIRGRTRVRSTDGGPWVTYTTLYARARADAVDLGEWTVARYLPYSSRLVAVRSKRRWVPVDRAKVYRARDRAIECAREPWLLSTSLRTVTARQVAALYKARMQIEETFRDTKSHRFGWGFEGARTSRAARVDIMFLLAALASLLVLIVGAAAEHASIHRSFQANTVSSRRVLALTTLGRLVLLHPTACSLLAQELSFSIPQRDQSSALA